MCKCCSVKWSWHNQTHGFAVKFQEENSQDFKPISGPVIGSGEELDVEDLYTKYKVNLWLRTVDHNVRQYLTISEGDCLQLSCLAMCVSLIYNILMWTVWKEEWGIWKVLFSLDQLRCTASHESNFISYDFFLLFCHVIQYLEVGLYML
jgi:hypothetical protein